MLNLQFLDHDPWDEECLAIIRRMREAVDIPFGVSLAEAPSGEQSCKVLFDAGIYRLFLPVGTDEAAFFSWCGTFTSRKIIPTVDLSFDFATKLPEYRARGIERVAIDISRRDTLETGTIEWTPSSEERFR